MAKRVLLRRDGEIVLSRKGEAIVADLGVDLAAARSARRALCKDCLDWSVRRSHLAGSLGAALLDRFFALGWARREKDSRAVRFTPPGLRAFERMLA
jgi:hypothetical protein